MKQQNSGKNVAEKINSMKFNRKKKCIFVYINYSFQFLNDVRQCTTLQLKSIFVHD